jgi:hypothetical protein
MNKQLWSPSYLSFMAGCSGCCLCFFYVLFDFTHWQPRIMRRAWRLSAPLQSTPLSLPQRDSVDGALR